MTEGAIIKAWRYYGPGDMRLDEVAIPQLRKNWVLVKVKEFQVVSPSM